MLVVSDIVAYGFTFLWIKEEGASTASVMREIPAETIPGFVPDFEQCM